jgi:hypothetical protein
MSMPIIFHSITAVLISGSEKQTVIPVIRYEVCLSCQHRCSSPYEILESGRKATGWPLHKSDMKPKTHWSPISRLKVDDTILRTARFSLHSCSFIQLEVSEAFDKSPALQSQDGILRCMIEIGNISQLRKTTRSRSSVPIPSEFYRDRYCAQEQSGKAKTNSLVGIDSHDNFLAANGDIPQQIATPHQSMLRRGRCGKAQSSDNVSVSLALAISFRVPPVLKSADLPDTLSIPAQ